MTAVESRLPLRVPASGRVFRDVSLILAGFAFVVLAYEVYLCVFYLGFGVPDDWNLYSSVARNWVGSGEYFLDRQVSGPHSLVWGDRLYPPTALWLFVPFAYLPGVLWWLVPAAIVGASLRRLRPAPWAWAGMGFLLWAPVGIQETISGNPLIWCVAGLFAAVAFGTPASFLLLKPSLLPFALWGLWKRPWWVGVGILLALSVPLIALDITWVRVVLDTRDSGGLFYSIREWPMLCVPLVAWIGSTTRGLPWHRDKTGASPLQQPEEEVVGAERFERSAS